MGRKHIIKKFFAFFLLHKGFFFREKKFSRVPRNIYPYREQREAKKRFLLRYALPFHTRRVMGSFGKKCLFHSIGCMLYGSRS